MKNINHFTFAVFIAVLLIGSSCKNNDTEPVIEEKTPANFAEIQLKHIKALDASMSTAKITASDAAGLVMKVGDVFVYKTAEGDYGKFEILKINQADNYKLTLKITNFAGDGSTLLATNSVDVRGTYFCDLDIVAETSETPTNDFHWNRLTTTNTTFDPKNGAKFMKYTFSKT